MIHVLLEEKMKVQASASQPKKVKKAKSVTEGKHTIVISCIN